MKNLLLGLVVFVTSVFGHAAAPLSHEINSLVTCSVSNYKPVNNLIESNEVSFNFTCQSSETCSFQKKEIQLSGLRIIQLLVKPLDAAISKEGKEIKISEIHLNIKKSFSQLIPDSATSAYLVGEAADIFTLANMNLYISCLQH